MNSRQSTALLIADHDQETAWPNVRNLAAYRESGTDWSFGRDINHLVDTVHHTNSAQSRLLQLTDVYAYTMSLCDKLPTRYPKDTIVQYVGELSDFRWPTKFKYWPPRAT